MCITNLINSILSNYFKPGYYTNSDKKNQILYLEEEQKLNINQQILYHNLTYDYGILILN